MKIYYTNVKYIYNIIAGWVGGKTLLKQELKFINFDKIVHEILSTNFGLLLETTLHFPSLLELGLFSWLSTLAH